METIKEISRKYDTDKAVHTHYLQNYAEFFESLINREVKLLELGIFHGGSLLMWRDYFPQGTIAGLDVNQVRIDDPSGRIHIYQGRQEDKQLLSKIAAEVAPDGFDVIIDDCAHIGAYSRISFRHLFENHLKPGGLYVIEDWGTGYWNDWTDGAEFSGYDFDRDVTFAEKLVFKLAYLQKNQFRSIPLLKQLTVFLKRWLLQKTCRSHNIGMVGFVKELVDECGVTDIYHAQFGAKNGRASLIREMRISPGHVFIIKA